MPRQLRCRTAGALVALTLTSGAGLAVGVPAVSGASPEDTTTTTMHAPADQSMPMPVPAVAYDFGETLSRLEGRELEVTFLAEIISHHQGAIEMAEMELERGQSPDIRTHAENIAANQRHQVEQFTRWLDEWYGLSPEEAMAEAPPAAQAQMAALEADMAAMMTMLEAVPPGPEFDAAFVRHMIPHHQAGIVEFLEPQSRAPHAELRVAASEGITVQAAQVADFRTWLSARSG